MEERVEFTMSDVIPEELLAGLSDTDREMESINRPSISYWRNCWIRLKKDKLAMLGIAIVVFLCMGYVFPAVVLGGVVVAQLVSLIFVSSLLEKKM